MQRESGLEQKDIQEKKPYEAIVVMPYSSGPYRHGRESKIDSRFSMSYETKMAATAALQAYKESKSDKIILLGEQTVGTEKGVLSTDQLIKEFLIAKGVPEISIIFHSGLDNSFQQLQRLSKIQNPDGKYLVVSLNFHQPRVKLLTKKMGIPAEHTSAEELLIKRSEHYDKPVKRWKHSLGMLKVSLIEVPLRILTRVDFDGKGQNAITGILGTRKALTDFPRQRKRK